MLKQFSLTFALIMLSGCAKDTISPEPVENSVSTTSETPSLSLKKSYAETGINSGKLSGTYLNAGSATPIVIIVPGSGPTDQDGNNQGFISNALKFLAQGLADNGISSVRVDKRGMFASKDAGDPNKVSVEIYAEDYRNWVKTATEAHGQDCAYLLGHSEGGLIVTAAAIDQDNVCGVITLAAPGRRLSDVLREQLKANPANAIIMDDAMAALTEMENGNNVDVSKMHPALLNLLAPAIQDYLISLFQVDPAALLAQVSAPKLVVQGSHDIQVTVEDAQRLADKSGARLVVLDGITHILKSGPEERMANILSYNSPDKPIDDGVVLAITEFVKN